MARIRNYWMNVRLTEDRMGNLMGMPVAGKHKKWLKQTYGTARAFAQEGSALRYEIMEKLTPEKRRAISEGYTETVRLPIDVYEAWVAYHNGI